MREYFTLNVASTNMSRSGDGAFAFLLGATASGFAVTGVVTLTGRSVMNRLPLAAGVVVLVGVTLVTDRRPKLAMTMARKQWDILLTVSAVGVTGWLGLQTTIGDVQSAPGWSWLAFGLLVPVLGVYVLANKRLFEWARETDSVVVEWRAEPSTRRRRLVKGALLLGALGAAVVGIGFSNRPVIPDIAPLLSGLLFAGAIFAGRRRHYVVMPDGLYVRDDGAWAGRFIPWSGFAGYEVTDRTLVLDRRLPLAALHSDRGEIDDVDAITAALDGVLADRSGQRN